MKLACLTYRKNLVQAEELIELAMRQVCRVGNRKLFSSGRKRRRTIAQAAAIAQSSEKFLKTMCFKSPFLVAVSQSDNGKVYNTANRLVVKLARLPVHLLTSTCPTAIPIENPVRSWLGPNCRRFILSDWVSGALSVLRCSSRTLPAPSI